ncbi:hypothetical protein ACVWXO_003453 [Bradyrhizobium sp. LM2.7]
MDTVRWAISTAPKILLMLAAFIVIRSPVLGVAVPHAVGNVVFDRVGSIIVASAFVG